ncbi:helix-turn-helix transcriptional regulator [Clostridium neuense]|uniref:Helix-turn-helix transcriptional regulator n=1 Tax=Clostridium neuense TaxID=1728934 RepID=A0ABW8THS9_9CLOT
MSKFSNLLKMIILLRSNGKMKISDISRELEVDERMVRKYKKDLELAHVYIKSTTGSNGGYSLEGYDHLLNLDIDEDEYSALSIANSELRQSNFIYLDEINSLTDKIMVAKKIKDKQINDVEYFIKSDVSIEQDKKKLLDVHKAIITKSKIRIRYFALSSGESNRIIHPYALINYRNAIYVAAYCEKRNSIRDFKISRMLEYEVLSEKFIFPKNFSLKEYMKNNFGIYRDGIYELKLHIFYPMSYIVSEKMWVNNQKITWKNDKSIIFEATMEGKTEIISWILSMGSKVKVLAPEELKLKIKDEAESIKEYYK